MQASKLNKTSTRHYWDRLLELPAHSLKNLFYAHNMEEEEQKSLFKEFVCIVNLETSAYCNRKCSYCPVSIDIGRKKQQYIKEPVFNKILEELESINYSSTIVLNLYNEPLADKNIFSRIGDIRSNLPKAFLMLNSNGDYANVEKLDKLCKTGLDAIFVTLHPPINKTFMIDDRLKDFKKFLKKIGKDKIKISNSSDIVVNQVANIDWDGMRLGIMIRDWQEYGNSRAGAIDFLYASATRTLPCSRPLREFTISMRGDVFPCCQFYPESVASRKYLLGNVSSETVFEIYASAALAKWRKNLFTFGEKSSPCDSCRDDDFSKDETMDARNEILEILAKDAEL